MKFYDEKKIESLKKQGVHIKISDDLRSYNYNGGNYIKKHRPKKNYRYSDDGKLTLKGNRTISMQNISILIIAVMILVVNHSVNTYLDESFLPGYFESFIKKDNKIIPPTPALIYDEQNDMNIIENLPEPKQIQPEDSEVHDITLINQNDPSVALPNGCEAVAMTMLLKTIIPDLSPHEFVNLDLPTAPYLKTVDGIRTGSDPEYYYIGNPAGLGFGIFAAGLAAGAEKCLNRYGITDKKVYNISGVSDEELFGYIDDGKYAVVWITMDMKAVDWGTYSWHLPSGKLYKWPTPEHCAVLVAHDAQTVTLYDPTNNIKVYDKALFLKRWHEIGPYEGRGRQAIVIY